MISSSFSKSSREGFWPERVRRKEPVTLTSEEQEEFDHEEDDEEQATRPKLPDGQPPPTGDRTSGAS